MKQIFSLFFVSALLINHSFAQLKAKDPLHVNNTDEAGYVIKVLTTELALDEMQQVRVQKIFENYIRRVDKAKEELASDTVQMNVRLKLLVENRDATLNKTLGEEKLSAYNELIPKMRQKIAELKKKTNSK
jgi:hypothetical protein